MCGSGVGVGVSVGSGVGVGVSVGDGVGVVVGSSVGLGVGVSLGFTLSVIVWLSVLLFSVLEPQPTNIKSASVPTNVKVINFFIRFYFLSQDFPM